MMKLQYIPNGLKDILDYYGSPGTIDDEGNAHVDHTWYKQNISFFKLSYSLRQSWDGKQLQGFIAHNKVGPAMIDALEEIKNYGGQKFLEAHKLEQWGGVFNPRNKRGQKKPSTHMWGISIDHCVHLAPYGEKSRMPFFIVEAFMKRGFITFPDFDGGHWQGAKGY